MKFVSERTRVPSGTRSPNRTNKIHQSAMVMGPMRDLAREARLLMLIPKMKCVSERTRVPRVPAFRIEFTSAMMDDETKALL